MGLQASIDILYSKDIDIKSFIDALFSIGWNADDTGKITYLTNDDFDWESDDLSNKESIINLLYKRFSSKKIVGIALTLPNQTGGLFHFLPNKNEIMILLNINRVKVKDTVFTDYTFYINNLYPVLDNLSKLNCSDVI